MKGTTKKTKNSSNDISNVLGWNKMFDTDSKLGPEETHQRSQMRQQDRKCKISAVKQQRN
jgi:hypothetical protein